MLMPDNLFASMEALCYLQAHLLPETRRYATSNATSDRKSQQSLRTGTESDDQITTWMLNALDMFSNEESPDMWTGIDTYLEEMVLDLEYEKGISTPSPNLTDRSDVDADVSRDCIPRIRKKRRARTAKWTRKKRELIKLKYDACQKA